MSDTTVSTPFVWQTDELVLETTAVSDLAAYLYEGEYRRFGYERHRAKARIRSAMARATKKGKLAPPVSSPPKYLNVRNLLLFACARWPELRGVIDTIDEAATVKPLLDMQIKVGSVVVDIDDIPATYSKLLQKYRLLRAAYLEEKSRRIDAENKLKKLCRQQSKRRQDGAKRYE